MRPEKEAMVQEIVQQVESSKAVLFANYMGLKAQELEDFRHALRPIASRCAIAKNTLFSRVLAKLNLPSVDQHLVGPTAMIFGQGDDVALAKVVMQFGKDHELLKLKVGIMDRRIVSSQQVLEIAKLPSREVLIARVVGSLKSPLYQLVGVLGAVPRGLVTALDAIKKKKETV